MYYRLEIYFEINVNYSYPNIKLLQLDWENLLPSPKRDCLGGQHHHLCDYFLKPSGSIILRCFETPNNNNNYFTIITIIGLRTNRSDASLKSILPTLHVVELK